MVCPLYIYRNPLIGRTRGYAPTIPCTTTTHSIVAHAGVYIGVGSRNEQGPEEGIAHFIEHSIFKGTEHRRSYHIRNRIDGVGGELDAFTTKEETCIYASALSEHLERCLELFADLIFHSTFPEHEIEKEKWQPPNP